MTNALTLHTSRLQLRRWRDEDLPVFAAMNADPRVMEFYPKPLDRAESDAMATRIRDHFVRRGFGLWAVEVPGVADFIGYVGLSVPTYERTSRRVWRSAGGLPMRTGIAGTPPRRPARFSTLASNSSRSRKSCRLPCRRTCDRDA